MANRPEDTLRVDAVGVGQFDRFTSFQVTTDMTAPFECALEVGDDGTWNQLEATVSPGRRYKVWVNDRLRMTGKVILDSIPSDAQGASVRFTIRTVIHEAMYSSADQRISITNATLKDVILRAYAGLGLTEADFQFEADVSRGIMTGGQRKVSTSKKDVSALTEEKAKVTPPETIYQFVDRHLRRFGLMHWDSPDGKIVVAAPDDTQALLYRFRSFFGTAGRANNVLSVERTRDWSEIPTVLGVFGQGGKAGFSNASVSAVAVDQEVIDAGFYRPVLIVSDGVRTQDAAARAARRELSARRKNKDAWTITVDGLAFRDGSRRIPYAVDTCCDIASNAVGGPSGAYYVVKTTMKRTAKDGDSTELNVVRKGLWQLEAPDDEEA